jgi:hypothetical protein
MSFGDDMTLLLICLIAGLSVMVFCDWMASLFGWE